MDERVEQAKPCSGEVPATLTKVPTVEVSQLLPAAVGVPAVLPATAAVQAVQATEEEREVAAEEQEEVVEGQRPEMVTRGREEEKDTSRKRTRTSASARVKFPKAGDKIEFKVGEEWREMTVVGRGCKTSSRTNTNYFNVREAEEGAEGLDLDKSEWRFNVQEAVDEDEEANITLLPVKNMEERSVLQP